MRSRSLRSTSSLVARCLVSHTVQRHVPLVPPPPLPSRSTASRSLPSHLRPRSFAKISMETRSPRRKTPHVLTWTRRRNSRVVVERDVGHRGDARARRFDALRAARLRIRRLVDAWRERGRSTSRETSTCETSRRACNDNARLQRNERKRSLQACATASTSALARCLRRNARFVPWERRACSISTHVPSLLVLRRRRGATFATSRLRRTATRRLHVAIASFGAHVSVVHVDRSVLEHA